MTTNSSSRRRFFIYLATCIRNGKVYVGKTSGYFSRRRWAHLNRRDYDNFFHRALRKYGSNSFVWQILAVTTGLEQANNLERLWIIVLRAQEREFGYNLTAGGDGSVGLKQSQETIERRRESWRKSNRAGLHRPHGRGWKRVQSEETKKRISEGLRRRPPKEKKACSVFDCQRPTHSNGFCKIHYSRLRRYGDPLAGNPIGTKGPLKGTKYKARSS